MIVPDTNLLLYAVVDGFAEHEKARTWWESTLSGREDVGFAPVVLHGFLRLATSSRVLDAPMTPRQASQVVTGWLDRSAARVLVPDEPHLRLVMELLIAVGTAGNLSTDAQIAAHALQHGAVVASNDTDFARFPQLSVVNPLRD